MRLKQPLTTKSNSNLHEWFIIYKPGGTVSTDWRRDEGEPLAPQNQIALDGSPSRRRKTLTQNLRCLAATPLCQGKASGDNLEENPELDICNICSEVKGEVLKTAAVLGHTAHSNRPQHHAQTAIMTLEITTNLYGARPVRTHHAGAVSGSLSRRSQSNATGGTFVSSCGVKGRTMRAIWP
ncbi:unnamed protein product [Mytilus coruscus]|uniref:Uncharacterized protein n=1 Tax=Mytilus coruscus TaxID=42192 RepID=A0A6J8CSM4_MYTCO|nr:unnamed protein product [Mytilus coruscus]